MIKFLVYFMVFYYCAIMFIMIIDFITKFKYDLINKIYEPFMFSNIIIIILFLIGAVVDA